MDTFKKMLIVPEKVLNDLKSTASTKNVPSDAFDSNIDAKYMEELKSRLVSILNGSEVDSATIKKYKADLAKLMDLEDYSSKTDAPTGNTSPSPDNTKDVKMQIDSDEDLFSDTDDLDFKSLNNTSELEFGKNISNEREPRASTPYTPYETPKSRWDETLEDDETPRGENIKKKLFDGKGHTSSLLDKNRLKNEKKQTVKNAQVIEQFILDEGDGRIKQSGVNTRCQEA